MFTWVALLSCLSCAAEDAADRELRRLEGTWVLSAVEADGERTPRDALKEFRLTFEGPAFTTVRAGMTARGTVKLDPTRKPRTMDISYTAGPEKGRTQQAIYELDGEMLRICGAAPGKDRPTDFETKGRAGWTLLLFRRVK
jgi:uncharacterized protein (TIGR03067 family)